MDQWKILKAKFSSSFLISKDIHKYIFTSFFLIFLYQIIKPTLTSCDQTLRGSQTLWLIIDLTPNPGLPLVKNKNTERSLDDATVTYHGSLTGSSHNDERAGSNFHSSFSYRYPVKTVYAKCLQTANDFWFSIVKRKFCVV